MSRYLPSDVANLLRPIPADFSPKFDDHGHYLRWSATLDVADHGPIDVEIGFHHPRAGNKADGPNHLRSTAWQATELARLGRLDLLAHCRVDRHRARRKG
jgi:hypothetical protein